MSALVLIMVLAFSADRLTKGLMFCLSFIPAWRKQLPDPELIQNRARRHQIQNRHLVVYTAIVGLIAGAAVYFFDDVRIISMLVEGKADKTVDILVTLLVIMGGSDLLGRIVQISGIGDTGAAAASGETAPRNKPVEIVGRLTLDTGGATLSGHVGPPDGDTHAA